MTDLFSAAHDRLIARLAELVTDRRVLDAMRSIPRALFVPDEQRHAANDAGALMIQGDALVPAPLLVARMCEALELRGGERVLDVGTGLGYRAAVLAGLCSEVVSVGTSASLAEEARARLRQAGITNVRTFVGDAATVGAEHAPLDAIVLAAATGRTESRALERHLGDGGRLLAPMVGRRLLLTCPRDGQRPVRLLPLVRPLHLS